MTIWNLTEDGEEKEPTVYDILGYPDIKCYKGAKKTGTGENTRPGKDLKEKIRVVTAHKRAITILNDFYGQPIINSSNNDPFEKDERKSTPQGDWYVEELNIYLALDDVDLVFETNMKAFNKTGVQLLCDRRFIHKEAKTIETIKGRRRILKDCHKPCALANSDDENWDCPNGCKPNGILHFYIRECLDADVMVHAQFETKAFGDVSNIVKRLRAIKKELGSLTQSPFPCYWTRHKIPFVLSRIMRSRKRPDTKLKPEHQWADPKKKEYFHTGKKGGAEFYDLDLQVDPVWMSWYESQKLLIDMQARGLKPGKEVMAGLMAGDMTIDVKAIAASVIETPSLPPSSVPVELERPEAEIQPQAITTLLTTPVSRGQRHPTGDMLAQLEDALVRNSWTEDAIAILFSDFGIQDPRSMTQEQWVEVCAIAQSPGSAREYNDAALAPPMPSYISKDDWLNRIEPVFRQNGWFPVREGKEDKSAVVGMIQSEYAVSRMGELLTSHVPEILVLAANLEVRDRWVK